MPNESAGSVQASVVAARNAGTSSSLRRSSVSGAALALLGRDAADRRRELGVRRRVDRSMLHLRARRILAEVVAVLPVARRTHRPRHEAAAAVGAYIEHHVLDAVAAERALVGADPRLRGIGRQRAVAVLAGGAQFQHATILAEAPH